MSLCGVIRLRKEKGGGGRETGLAPGMAERYVPFPYDGARKDPTSKAEMGREPGRREGEEGAEEGAEGVAYGRGKGEGRSAQQINNNWSQRSGARQAAHTQHRRAAAEN